MPFSFQFSPQDFAFSFLSILFEGIPFVLLGTMLSGAIDAFLPSRVMTRLLPKNGTAAILLCGGLGLIFPMCECGIVPVIRRLLGKGLPLSCALAYMLSTPIVNPVVILSTYAAFRGQSPELMVFLRLAIGFAVAVAAGFATRTIPARRILNGRVMDLLPEEGKEEDAAPAPAFKDRIRAGLRVATTDFLDVTMYLVIGAILASLFNTGIDQSVILPLAMNPWMATISMMGLAGVLSLCSSSDAFIAATFVTFSGASKLAFLVFGPMMDLKLLFLYGIVFRKRFVLALGAGLFVVIGLICVKLDALPF